MGSPNDMLPPAILPHQVVVELLLVPLGESGTAQIVAVLGGNVAQADAAIDQPLLLTAEAVLIANVAVQVEIFALPPFAAFPFEVIVAQP